MVLNQIAHLVSPFFTNLPEVLALHFSSLRQHQAKNYEYPHPSNEESKVILALLSTNNFLCGKVPTLSHFRFAPGAYSWITTTTADRESSFDVDLLNFLFVHIVQSIDPF